MAYLRRFLQLPANESSLGLVLSLSVVALGLMFHRSCLAGGNYRQPAGGDPLAGRNEDRRLKNRILPAAPPAPLRIV
jgi:hypothetical protein